MINITAARKTKNNSFNLNITPLIDMVFILLIFFLVTTSFIKETGVDIHRPTASTAAKRGKALIKFGLTKNNKIYFDRREIDIRMIRPNVERWLAENPHESVVIVADQNSSTGMVIAIMDECRKAGAKNVSLAAALP